MKKKIAFIEIDTHAEIAKQFFLLMKESLNCECFFFVSDRIIKINEWETLENVISTNKNSVREKLAHYCPDYVVVGTLHRNFSLFDKIVNDYKTGIILHNLNFSFSSNCTLLPKLLHKNFFYHLKLIFREGLLMKNKVLKKANKLWVLDENLLNNRSKIGEIEYLPLFYSEILEENNSETDTIVIPGRVDQNRRNYQKVFEEIENYNENKHIKIVFLGKAENEELQKLEKLQALNQRIEVVYFKAMIPQTEFEFWMKHARFLWCPIIEKSMFMGVEEKYSLTKMTGNRGDCIKYSKMGFFPKFYPKNEDFIFEEDSFENMMRETTYSLNFQEKYSKTVVKTMFNQILNNL